MRVIFLLLSVISCLSSAGQKKKVFDSYLTFQFTKTTRDVTIGNNPWGMGTGLQTWFNVNRYFRPLLEVTGDVYLENDKVQRLGPNNEDIESVTAIANVFAGPSLQASKSVNLSFAAGPSFVNKRVLLGIKPSLHVFMPKQRAYIKVAYINVFNRGTIIPGDFTSYSIGVGFRVY